MYFDFDDRYTDIEPVGRAINLRDGVVVSVLFHVAAIAVLILLPILLPPQPPSQEEVLRLQQQQQETPQFVFVQPRVDMQSKPRERADMSDLDRRSRSIERAPTPDNALPFARGNSAERAESTPEDRARGRGPAPQPAPEVPDPETIPQAARDESQMAMTQKPQQQPPPGGSLGEALKNLQKYVQQESFDNQKGGNTQEFGPAIQFDTKGVEFGPWIRRFVAQVKRNWFIPYAAMTMRGHVVITFNVHRNGMITDVTVVQPSMVESFNTAAVNALIASSPTEPLPPEYPDSKAFFTVTFFYNEGQGGQQ